MRKSSWIEAGPRRSRPAGGSCAVRLTVPRVRGRGFGSISPTCSDGTIPSGTVCDDASTPVCPAGLSISCFTGTCYCVNSAGNCAAAGGTLDPVTGTCSAPAGGSLYVAQLAAAAAECPWYCLPFVSYAAGSPCFSCQTPAATMGGIPIWAWIGIGLGAALVILPKVVK